MEQASDLPQPGKRENQTSTRAGDWGVPLGQVNQLPGAALHLQI